MMQSISPAIPALYFLLYHRPSVYCHLVFVKLVYGFLYKVTQLSLSL